MKKAKKKGEVRISRKVNNTRGSKLWSFNHFRSRILTSILNDLIKFENKGLCNEPLCLEIQATLDNLINAAIEIPSGGFLGGGPIYKDIESFKDVYVVWNGIDGEAPSNSRERHKVLIKLRKKRQKISDKARTIQYLIENNLDQIIIENAYRAIGEMIKMVPAIFLNLSSSYKSYTKVMGL
ncbi:MAG: hypothetical protein ACOYN4_07615 [Bacteroidales bacterium]